MYPDGIPRDFVLCEVGLLTSPADSSLTSLLCLLCTGTGPFQFRKKKIVLKIRRKLHVNYPWLAVLDNTGGFHFSGCEWLYKHYLHCSPRALQHTVSSAAGAVKAFLNLRLSKTAWVLQPPHANWPLLPFLLRTWWSLFPRKWLCNKSMSLILLFVTLFLTTGLHWFVCTLPTVLGRGGRTICRSWKLWRKYNTVNLLSLCLIFQFWKDPNSYYFLVQRKTVFGTKDTWVWSCGRWTWVS